MGNILLFPAKTKTPLTFNEKLHRLEKRKSHRLFCYDQLVILLRESFSPYCIENVQHSVAI